VRYCQTLQNKSRYSDTETTDGTGWGNAESGQDIQDKRGRSEKETTNSTLWGNDRLLKTTVDTVPRNTLTVHCEVLTESGQNLQDTSGRSDTEKTYGTLWGTDRQWTECTRPHWTQWCRTNRRYNVRYCLTLQDISENSDTEQTECTLWGTDRQWTVCSRQLWTQWQKKTGGMLWGTNRQWDESTGHDWMQWHRTNRRYNVKHWHTVDRICKTPVDAVTRKQQWVQCELLTDSGQNIQDTIARSDTEPTNGTMWSNNKQLTEWTRHQWTIWHGTTWQYNVRYWQTLDRLYKTPVDAVTQNL